MEYIIFIYDRTNKIPMIGGTFDTKEDAEKELLNIKNKLRKSDENCENYGCWINKIGLKGKMTYYYFDKSITRRNKMFKKNDVERTEEREFDLEKARKYDHKCKKLHQN